MLEAGKVSKQAESVSFVFFVFLVYLCFLYLRPIELFAEWLADYRPMLIIWLIAFGGSLVHVLRHKDAASSATHYWLLFWLMVAIALSQLWKGKFSEAMAAIADFSASMLLFFLISFNVLSMRRLRIACIVILMSLFAVSV